MHFRTCLLKRTFDRTKNKIQDFRLKLSQKLHSQKRMSFLILVFSTKFGTPQNFKNSY